VIVALLQFKNAVTDQLQEQLLAETTLKHLVKELVHLELLLLLITVIVMQLQSKNVEMDQLQEQLLAEITQELLVKEVVLLQHQELLHQ
jgi:hypothetical protein